MLKASRASRIDLRPTPKGLAGIETGTDFSAPTIEDPREVYLEQLQQEGLAFRTEDGWNIPWQSIYSIRHHSDHASSVSLLGLPPDCSWAPILESSGTPSDSSFLIRIAGWRDDQGSRLADVRRQGALLTSGSITRLMSSECWALMERVLLLSVEGRTWSSERRLRIIGEVKKLAASCGAGLDRYLTQSDVAIADHVGFEFKPQKALGTRVIEIVPRLEGAPPEFVSQFDRYDTVRGRYDVTRGDGGVTHVLPGDAARSTLSSVKAVQGRRLAGDSASAFLRNPFAVLGEDAVAAVDEDQFTQSRLDAGLTFWRISVEAAEPKVLTLRLTDVDGTRSDEVIRLSTPDQMRSLYETALRSRRKGLTYYNWDGEDIECDGRTGALLSLLGERLQLNAIESPALRYAEVFDLSAYSERVVGFDGTPIAVPYVARKDAGKGWIPENMEYGLLTSPGAIGAKSEPVALDDEKRAALVAAIAHAKDRGADTVSIDGLREPVSVAIAEAWLDAFSDFAPSKGSKRTPELQKDPSPPAKPVLRILHNIEQLDYGTDAKRPEDGPLAPQVPKSLAHDASLLPHQLDGLAWLQDRLRRNDEGITGCLLADDMGVGKTLQAMSLIAQYIESEASPKPCLVVAPVSLLSNWQREISKFFPSLGTEVLTAYGAALSGLRAPTESIDPELRAAGLLKFLLEGFERRSKIVLTTYETLRDYEFSFGRVGWGIVICDEAQRIKTPKALVTRAAKALQADFRIACTGTPVENSLADLWCLFDFFQPGLLGSLNEFTKVFRRTIETRTAGHEELVERLRSAVDPWILRRMKEEVAALPPKLDAGVSGVDSMSRALPMSPLQAQLYGTSIHEFRGAIKTSRANGAHILELLHTLRMICSNPVAVSSGNADLVSVDEHIRHSPKLRWLLARLDEIRRAGEKVIVFTEFRDIQRLIQRAVSGKLHFRPAIVNGSTSVDPHHAESRQAIIDEFQRKPGFGVIVLSTTAVGFGVNIQAANHVIHFTRPWNPAKEDQATDRAYRIGQERSVHVYCPTIKGSGFESFDERVDQLLTAKRALSRDMLSGTQEISLAEFESL